MTLGLARPSRAMVVCSSPSVQTAWRCVGRLALCTMATGWCRAGPYSSSSWMWAAPLTPVNHQSQLGLVGRVRQRAPVDTGVAGLGVAGHKHHAMRVLAVRQWHIQ